MRAIAYGFALVVSLAACDGPTISGTACNDDKDCNLFNAQGRCESSGFCSFPDETCASGHRYSPGATGDLASACVEGAGTCGNKGQQCCGASACADHLTCVTESGTCACGALDQACCEGTTCDAGMRCGGTTCSTSSVSQAAVGAGHACALFADHTVACWGHDFKPYGSYPGVGDAVLASSTPVTIRGATDIVELRAAEMHTCGRKMDGTLWCWGHNENGQLGDGTTTHSKVAVQVAGLTNVTLFDGGRRHTCALGTYNATAPGLWCWGRGGENGHNATGAVGKLGNNSSSDSKVPVRVDLSAAAAQGQTVKSLSTGSYHSCIVMSDDRTWCWGRNANGELGNGTTTPSKVPVLVSYAGITIPTGVTVDQVSCSDGRSKQNSTCILLSNGTVYCWGANTHRELGDGGNVARSAPSTAVNLAALGAVKIVQLAAGEYAKCARSDDGGVWCWGENKNGILGINNGSVITQGMPVKANVLSTAALLDMSHRLACAIDSANQLFCWGTNRRGQARAKTPADATEAAVLEPTRVTF